LDVSTPLLKHAESVAADLGFDGQCSFVKTPAQTLLGIANESVDVITSRAMLAYVDDKPSAIRSFFVFSSRAEGCLSGSRSIKTRLFD
jgi:ubiquinone/menaquinone biosynthesis C-methylase UbiE